MIRLLPLLLFALLVGEGVAEAWQGVGSHIRRSTDAPRNLSNRDEASALRAANFLGRCVAEGRGTFARELLALELGGEEQRTRAGRVISAGEECMNDLGFQLRADALTVAGGMAEYYLLDVYTGSDVPAVAGTETGPAPRNGLEQFGQCVARRNPNGVRTLVQTEPASDDESAAARAMVPDLGPCVPAGETIGLTPRAIRATTAVGLYQLLATSRPTAAEAAE